MERTSTMALIPNLGYESVSQQLGKLEIAIAQHRVHHVDQLDLRLLRQGLARGGEGGKGRGGEGGEGRRREGEISSGHDSNTRAILEAYLPV